MDLFGPSVTETRNLGHVEGLADCSRFGRWPGALGISPVLRHQPPLCSS